MDFTPSKVITYVQDLIPVKASLQTKMFNQAGEFNENALQTVATENVDLQSTEPLAYQEWSKTYQSRNGETASQETYQQYLDNFEYSRRRQVSNVNNSIGTESEQQTEELRVQQAPTTEFETIPIEDEQVTENPYITLMMV